MTAALKRPCVKIVRFWKSSCKIFIFPTYCLIQNFMPTILNFIKISGRKIIIIKLQKTHFSEHQNVRHYFKTWCLWLLKSFPLTQRWIPYGLMANIYTKKQSMLLHFKNKPKCQWYSGFYFTVTTPIFYGCKNSTGCHKGQTFLKRNILWPQHTLYFVLMILN